MARLYPNQIVGSVSPENARVFQALSQIPGDDTQVWMSLQSDEHWRPDWMILHENRVCYLLVTSNLTVETRPFLQENPPGKVESEQLGRFFHNLSTEAPIPPVFGVVLFPNLSQEYLDEIQMSFPNPKAALWGREMVSGEVLHEALQLTEGVAPFPIHWQELLRQKICPETRIPREMTLIPKQIRRRNSGPRHTRQLLDLDQEYLVKADLKLNPEALEAVISSKTRLVTGVAGSGKSLVLLYRAMLQSRFEPDAKILTLTHNRPLSFELRVRQEKIQKGSTIKWQTFYQWCERLLPNELPPICPFAKLQWLNELQLNYTSLQHFSVDFLVAEIDWLREQGFSNEEDYLTASRKGRTLPLTFEQRESIRQLLAEYRKKLASEQKTDWQAITESVWQALNTGQIVTPFYDHILIDEAQFFPPLWFKMLQHCLAPERGTLFLAADPTQGFLQHRSSWRDCGIQVRGHSVRLLKGYRNCREILQFAAHFYRSRLPDWDMDDNLPNEADLVDLPAGLPPHFLVVDQSEDESTCAANEILQALKMGQNPANFLVIFGNGNAVTHFVDTINLRYGSEIAWNTRQPHQPHPMVRVATLNSATGLESQAVFLCGIDDLFVKEQKIDLESDEKEELIRDHTRKIYMALTRASRQVYVVHRQPKTREILEGISESH